MKHDKARIICNEYSINVGFMLKNILAYDFKNMNEKEFISEIKKYTNNIVFNIYEGYMFDNNPQLISTHESFSYAHAQLKSDQWVARCYRRNGKYIIDEIAIVKHGSFKQIKMDDREVRRKEKEDRGFYAELLRLMEKHNVVLEKQYIYIDKSLYYLAFVGDGVFLDCDYLAGELKGINSPIAWGKKNE